MSNTSLSEFINAAAKLMLADRPHLWADHDDAVQDITSAFSDASSLDPDDPEEYSVHFSGFTLTRVLLDDGFFEYTMSKKLIALAIDTGDEESYIHDWTVDGKLANIGLDLPEIEEDLDIFPDIDDDLNYEDDEE